MRKKVVLKVYLKGKIFPVKFKTKDHDRITEIIESLSKKRKEEDVLVLFPEGYLIRPKDIVSMSVNGEFVLEE